MIQDIAPHFFNNHYLPDKEVSNNDFIFHYRENSMLLKSIGHELVIPRMKDLPAIPENTQLTFLFTLDDVCCFLIISDLPIDNYDFIFKDIGFFRTEKKKEMAWASLAGLHLMKWYTQNRFCGKCGSVTKHKADERALECPACTTTYYPKICPAVIVAIISDDKILLARGSNFPGGWYSLPAGYADVGESLEDTVIREVKEEVGLDVRNVRYYKSQPWPLSASMMIGFIAEADASQSLILDETEISDAQWFDRNNLPHYPSDISIAGEMIGLFERGEI